MKIKLLVAVVALLLVVVPKADAQSDSGIPDTVALMLSLQPDSASNQLNVVVEIWGFTDQLVTGVSGGYFWDNSKMQVDSATSPANIESAFDLGRFYFDANLIDSSNISQRFLFGASKLFSSGLAGDASGRRLWGTYYFTLTNWTTLDSITIDTVEWNTGSKLKLATSGSTGHVPYFTGKIAIKDALDVVALGDNLPTTFALDQNYPNPFNPTTQINFDVPARSHVTLDVFNVLGQRVISLVNEDLAASSYTVDWDGRSEGGEAVASGVYFYRMEAGDFVQTKKMMLLK
ncbi:MAG: T9SS type A sorting domain-containing protein [Candidatus Zixiibacteriota bacterium]